MNNSRVVRKNYFSKDGFKEEKLTVAEWSATAFKYCHSDERLASILFESKRERQLAPQIVCGEESLNGDSSSLRSEFAYNNSTKFLFTE